MEFVVYGGASSNCTLTEIEWKLNRPFLANTGATVTKFGDQNLYYSFSWWSNHVKTASIYPNGDIYGHSISASGTIYPATDNNLLLGTSSNRFNAAYITTMHGTSQYTAISSASATNTPYYLVGVTALGAQNIAPLYTYSTVPSASAYILGGKVYLSIQEIRQLKNSETLTEGQKKVLDVFLVQAFTGFSYKTLQEFLKNPLAFVKEFEGKTYIEIERSKTGEISAVPLHTEVQRIITKYNGVMPEFTEVYVNRTLKIIGRKAGLNNPIPIKITKGGEKVTQITEKYNLITTHTARRTMVSLGMQNGLSTASLQAITGHTTEQQLNRYNRTEKVLRIKDILGHQFFKEEI